jgi:hypothetical protein
MAALPEMPAAMKKKTKAKAKAKAKAGADAPRHRIFVYPFAKIYPLWLNKVERKGRTKRELDEVICWLTGYTQAGLQKQLGGDGDLERFFVRAPAFNPASRLIKGTVCGVRVEEVEDPLMRKIRYADKLIDELAQGRAMEKILRQA